MKVAILAESPADEAGLKILIEGVLEVAPFRARVGGIDAVFRDLPAVLKSVHYQQTAEAFVVAVDSDSSTLHSSTHQTSPQSDCRVCQLSSSVTKVLAAVRPSEGRAAVKWAIAVPTPSIEAWYLFGEDSTCSEAEWARRKSASISASSEIKRLKKLVYGTDQPGLMRAKECAAARSAALLPKLASLEQFFPNSFGLFASQLREWTN